jgi:hypothetical protein
MTTNLALDDALIEEARRAGKHKTKKEAVTAALGEYIQRRKQVRILEAFGSFDFDPGYDYKAERRGQKSANCGISCQGGKRARFGAC